MYTCIVVIKQCLDCFFSFSDSQMSSGSQCTDDGGLGSVFCFLNKNKVQSHNKYYSLFLAENYCMISCY